MTLFRFFFFNDTATTEIYTLSLHDALPIWLPVVVVPQALLLRVGLHERDLCLAATGQPEVVGRLVVDGERSEEHTSELQSRQYLVCRLLLEKKKKTTFFTPCTTISLFPSSS